MAGALALPQLTLCLVVLAKFFHKRCSQGVSNFVNLVVASFETFSMLAENLGFLVGGWIWFMWSKWMLLLCLYMQRVSCGRARAPAMDEQRREPFALLKNKV